MESQEEMGRERMVWRLYWGVEVGGEGVGNIVRETSMVRDYRKGRKFRGVKISFIWTMTIFK